MDGPKEGRIGLCLLGIDSTDWTVNFDNLQIFALPGIEAVDATPVAAPTASIVATRKPFQQSWDFSAGMLHDTRTEAVDLVDGATWKRPEGKYLHFLTAGKSFLEATFDVPEGADAPSHLIVRHYSPSPKDNNGGYSPVRITLNGNEIFRGSSKGMTSEGWTEDQIDLGNYVQPGRNTLLWEYLDGAQTPYWLKSFRLSSGNP
jgi:hypothetical protein